jgi:hypothetical protein
MNMQPQKPPKGVLLDYGGTLVEEVEFDARAGNELLLARAAYRPQHVSLDQVLERVNRVATEVAAMRDQYHLETPWPTLTRLIHDFFGIRFADPMAELEMAFWRASVKTNPMLLVTAHSAKRSYATNSTSTGSPNISRS